jgi:excisionase family DNA binding protein
MSQEHEGHVARDGDGPEGATPSTPSRLTYSVDEVAEILGISRSATYECIARGEIPAKRLGRRVVVVRSALEEFLAQSDSPNRPHLPPVRRLA